MLVGRIDEALDDLHRLLEFLDELVVLAVAPRLAQAGDLPRSTVNWFMRSLLNCFSRAANRRISSGFTMACAMPCLFQRRERDGDVTSPNNRTSRPEAPGTDHATPRFDIS